MKTSLIAAVLVATMGIMQAGAESLPKQVAQQTVASSTAPASASVVVPAGTVVPLNLVSPIKSVSTKPGDKVRAMVAFPVTVGDQLAIPAGVFVEGQLVQVQFPKGFKAPKGAPPTSPLKVNFTKLIYPNGYTVGLDAQVSVLKMDDDGTEMAEVTWPSVVSHGPSATDIFEAEPQQTTTTTNPYAHAGPNPAVIYGPIIAAAVIATATILVAHHHGPTLDTIAYDAGYQFQMTLATPLVLDVSRVSKDADVQNPSAAQP